MKLPHTLFTLLFLISSLNAQTVERGPYLQSGGSHSIIIKWRTDDHTTSKVWIGDQVGNLNTTFENDTNYVEDHEMLINNLTPNTKYYYAVGHDDDILAGGDSKHFFTTAPIVGTSHPIRAWVLGDCGTGGSGASAVRDAFYDYNNDEDLDMILLLGDNAYGDGTDDEYQGAIFEKYYKMIRETTMWSCMGNHDYRSADIDNESGPYFDIFTFPENGELGGVASGTEAYYSFDYANVHFIALDSEASDKDPGDPMLIWLENDLNTTSQDWIIVMFHHPPYSKGSHDSDADNEESLIAMRENVLPILDAGGVDLVLSGHSHSYERSYLLNGHYGESDELEPEMILDDGDGKIDGSGAYQKATVGAEANKGAVYVVSGSAAKTSSGDLDHPVMYYSKKELGSVLLELDGNQLDLKFINKDEEVADYFTMIKTGLSGGIAPEVTIANPIDNQTFLENEIISITANATDSDGNVTKVEFYIDNNYLSTDYSAPYSVDWSVAEIGNHTIAAVATDNDGNATNSNLVNVSVIANEIGISITSCPTNITLPCVDSVGASVTWAAPLFESDCDEAPGIPDCTPINIADAIYLGTFDESHFFQTNASMEWGLAKVFAEENGGFLATINSAEENDFIAQAISLDGWIGYSDKLAEGQFEWVDGSTSNYENWGYFQPSGSGENADDYTLFSVFNGTWNDKEDHKNKAILEVPCATIGGGGNGLQVSQTSGFVNGALFPEGTTTITYEAIDACENTATCSFEVTVGSCAPPTPCNPTLIDGFSWVVNSSKSMYYLSDEKENWEDAKVICESLGGHLVYIDSQEENDLLLSQLEDLNDYALIGMSDHLLEGNVVWSDGSALLYDNTAGNSDNDDSNDFGLMNSWTGTWDFVNEWVSKRYILEIPCGNSIMGIQNLTNTTVAAPSDLYHNLTEAQESETLNTIHLFPNPVKDILNLHFVGDEVESNVLLKITSMDSKQVLSQVYAVKKGMNIWSIPTSQLLSGSYFLQVIMEDGVFVERIIKL